MSKTKAAQEKLLRLVGNLTPPSPGETAADLEELKQSLGETVEASLEKLLIDGVRKLQEEGGDTRRTIPAFVAQVLSVAQQLDADTTAITSHSIALLMDAGSATKPARKKDTRSLILEAALDVFSKQGFHTTTVDQIAEAAGLGKGTLYRYFPTKEALYQALIVEKWNELITAARSEFHSQTDVVESIRAATRAYLEFFEQNAKLHRLLLKEPLATEKEMREQYMEMMLKEIPAIKDHILRDSGAGRFKQVNFYTVFYGYMGFVEGVIQKWLRNDCRHSLVAELDTIMNTVLFGFVAEEAPDRQRTADAS